MMAVPSLQRYPWSFKLMKIVEYIVVTPGWEEFISLNFIMFSCSRNAQVTFAKNPKLGKVFKIINIHI